MAQTRKQKTKGQGLKRFFITNYQAHKKTLLKFHPGINVISGSSHAGKTSIIRALKKLVTNRPLGAKFYNNKGPKNGTTRIEAKFFDNTTVRTDIEINKSVKDGKTVKKMKRQTYQVIGDMRHFSFQGGRFMPDMVVENLNLHDINFQLQHDPPLLLSSSNTKLAQLVSDITRLDKAYEVKSELQTRVKKAKTKEGVISANVKRLTKEFNKYSDLKEFDKVLSELRMEEVKLHRVGEKIGELLIAKKQLSGIDRRISVREKAFKTYDETYQTMSKLYKEFVGKNKDVEILRVSYNNIKTYRELQGLIDEVEKEYVDSLRTFKTCPMCGQSTTGL